MSQYEHSLIAMKRLLDAVGETHWADWIKTDIEQWRSKRSTSRHLSVYGGMGSFNDIWICRTNQHKITQAQEPWANALFERLQSLCYYLAQHPKASLAAKRLSKVLRRHDSALVALMGGDAAPNSMRRRANEDRELHGWRCLLCGHSEASNGDVERLIAQDVVPQLVFQSCEGWSLDKLVDQVLACDIAGIENVRQTLARAVTASGITLRDRDGWMQPCPKCGNKDTAVYRWRMTVKDGVSFQPSDDNLPMRAAIPSQSIELSIQMSTINSVRFIGKRLGRWLSRLLRR